MEKGSRFRMKFILLEGPQNIYKYVSKDIIKEDNTKVIFSDTPFRSKYLNIVTKILLSSKINKIVSMPFKKFIYKRIFSNLITNDEKCSIIIVSNWFSKDLMRYLNKHYPRANKNLVFRDTIEAYSKNYKDLISDIYNSQINNVFCFSKKDALKYNFNYYPAYISKVEESLLLKYEHKDAVFLGHAKDRIDMIVDVNRRLNHLGISNRFIVTNAPNKTYAHQTFKYSKKYLSYLEYISIQNSASCIVEILKKNTDGNTYRCWEAVLYNKKLITNWSGILDFEFYDSRYMLYFQNPEDIKLDFFINNQNVNYGYSNTHTPLELLKLIRKTEKEKKDELSKSNNK